LARSDRDEIIYYWNYFVKDFRVIDFKVFDSSIDFDIVYYLLMLGLMLLLNFCCML
jgi:hypothetical protein